MKAQLTILAMAAALAPFPAGASDWRPAERIETYPISGETGIALYRSIGENGPKVGVGRAIAYTTFDLKWSRDYFSEGSGCTLRSARPHLTVIYRLPKPAEKLPADLRKLWDAFIDGIEAHERVHGAYILDMTKATEAATVGLSVADDPGCKEVRALVAERALAANAEQRRRGADFDRAEMRDGGNVHQLVLALVNGG
jgi:predicted secreted Zn-dependent protease